MNVSNGSLDLFFLSHLTSAQGPLPLPMPLPVPARHAEEGTGKDMGTLVGTQLGWRVVDIAA